MIFADYVHLRNIVGTEYSKMHEGKATIYKTVCQYSREAVSPDDMKKLLEIAEDYRRVKNYVYQRYGGIGGLTKIYPGYTVQNEMIRDGLRESLEMPSVYFYLAILDALRNIRGQWTRTKSKILKLTGENREFVEKERHYLRFLLKVDSAFEAVLNQKPILLKPDLKRKCDLLAEEIDVQRVHRYLCRQVRKFHVKPHTDLANGFSISSGAYRYADHGIYLSVKEKRKRIFVPLTDNNQYKCQLYVKLYMEEARIEIKAPIKERVREHADYTNQVGLALGMVTMITTDEGHSYGTELGIYQTEYADWLRRQTGSYQKNKAQNPGRMKYENQKRRYEERLHSYINKELNRFLQTEKPRILYLSRLPEPRGKGPVRIMNYYATLWQRGFIHNRLAIKCKEQSVEIVEVIGKDISNECSYCGNTGQKTGGLFVCLICGHQIEEKVNTARNAKKRGRGDGALRKNGELVTDQIT